LAENFDLLSSPHLAEWGFRSPDILSSELLRRKVGTSSATQTCCVQARKRARWARPLLEDVKNGELEFSIQSALAKVSWSKWAESNLVC
jgi:hypothetical protein